MAGLIKKILPFIAAGTIVVGGSIYQPTDRQIDFTSTYEGYASVPYEDIANPTILTVCHGLTDAAAGKGWVVAGKHYTEDDCRNKEIEVVGNIAKEMQPLIKVDITQQQYEMLVDFSFNLGVPKFAQSTLLKKINKNDCFGSANEFSRWVRSGKIVYRGLVARRTAEADNFVKWCVPDGTFPSGVYQMASFQQKD